MSSHPVAATTASLGPLRARALRRVVSMHVRRDGVEGIVLYGSAARGVATASSDLDVFVLMRGSVKQWRQARFSGVEVGLVYGSWAFLDRALRGEGELVRDRDYAVRVLRDGRVLYDPRGSLLALKARAVALFYGGREPPPAERVEQLRLRLARAEGWLSQRGTLGASEQVRAISLFLRCLDALGAIGGAWTGKRTQQLEELQRADPVSYDGVRAFLEAQGGEARRRSLRVVLQRTLRALEPFVPGLADGPAPVPTAVAGDENRARFASLGHLAFCGLCAVTLGALGFALALHPGPVELVVHWRDPATALLPIAALAFGSAGALVVRGLARTRAHAEAEEGLLVEALRVRLALTRHPALDGADAEILLKDLAVRTRRRARGLALQLARREAVSEAVAGLATAGWLLGVGAALTIVPAFVVEVLVQRLRLQLLGDPPSGSRPSPRDLAADRPRDPLSRAVTRLLLPAARARLALRGCRASLARTRWEVRAALALVPTRAAWLLTAVVTGALVAVAVSTGQVPLREALVGAGGLTVGARAASRALRATVRLLRDRSTTAHTVRLAQRHARSAWSAPMRLGQTLRLDRVACAPKPGLQHVESVRRVSLTIERGQLIVVLAPPDRSADLLLEVIAGVREPTSGQILLDGLPVSGALRWERRVAYFARPPQARLERGSILGAAYTGLTVAAVRAAALRSPELVIVDETEGLHASEEPALFHALDDLYAGRTALVRTARRSLVARADQVVVLEHGEHVMGGRHQDLWALSEAYQKLYGGWTNRV